jgi:hypothetical protein
MKTSGSGNAAKMAGGVTRKNVPQVGNKGNQMPIHGHGSTKGGGDNSKNTTGFEPR